MKKPLFLAPAFALALCAGVQASPIHLVPAAHFPLSMPAAPAATLPLTLPARPQEPLSIYPGVLLPGPVSPIPLMRKTVAAAQPQTAPASRDGKFDELFDGRGRKPLPFDIAEERLHTIPEKELLDEIGIRSY